MKASDFTSPEDVCVKVGAEPLPPAAGDRIGLSRSARSDRPVHGLRITPTPGVSGWYVWAGEMMSEVEVPYRSLFATERAWTCDFVVALLADSGRVRFGIECTAGTDARGTIAEKRAACEAVGFTLVVVRTRAIASPCGPASGRSGTGPRP